MTYRLVCASGESRSLMRDFDSFFVNVGLRTQIDQYEQESMSPWRNFIAINV